MRPNRASSMQQVFLHNKASIFGKRSWHGGRAVRRRNSYPASDRRAGERCIIETTSQIASFVARQHSASGSFAAPYECNASSGQVWDASGAKTTWAICGSAPAPHLLRAQTKLDGHGARGGLVGSLNASAIATRHASPVAARSTGRSAPHENASRSRPRSDAALSSRGAHPRAQGAPGPAIPLRFHGRTNVAHRICRPRPRCTAADSSRPRLAAPLLSQEGRHRGHRNKRKGIGGTHASAPACAHVSRMCPTERGQPPGPDAKARGPSTTARRGRRRSRPGYCKRSPRRTWRPAHKGEELPATRKASTGTKENAQNLYTRRVRPTPGAMAHAPAPRLVAAPSAAVVSGHMRACPGARAGCARSWYGWRTRCLRGRAVCMASQCKAPDAQWTVCECDPARAQGTTCACGNTAQTYR